jgi:capsular exopolysaccharide synthesis family protein
LRGSPGLSTVLSGQAELEDGIQHVPLGQEARDGSVRTLDVILAGPLPPNPSDLLESDHMRELLAALGAKYELLVVDTPPTSVVSDAIPLVKQVGGVIVVARLGKTTREAAQHLCDQLRNLDAPVLGVVVNGIGSEAGRYGYGYAYGYGQQAEGAATKAATAKPASSREKPSPQREETAKKAETSSKAGKSPEAPDDAGQTDLEAEGEGKTLRDARRSAIKRLERRFPGITVESVRFEVIEVGDAVPARVRAQVDPEAWRTATNGDLLEQASGSGSRDPNSSGEAS